VTPDGKGLAPGSSTAAAGKSVYVRRCETCHGQTAQKDRRMFWSAVRARSRRRGLKRPSAATGRTHDAVDYIRRAMPFEHPGTLTTDEVYGATAYVLFMNGIIKEQDVIDQTTLAEVKMPNRNGFTADPRPDMPLRKK